MVQNFVSLRGPLAITLIQTSLNVILLIPRLSSENILYPWKDTVFLGTLWLCAQLLANYSLGFLSVPTSTVLSSTSAFVVYVVAMVVGIDNWRLRNFVAICATVIGVCFVTCNAPPAVSTAAGHQDSVLGIILCFSAQLPYALFAVYLKLHSTEKQELEEALLGLPEEGGDRSGVAAEEHEMCRIFGSIGLFALLIGTPIMGITACIYPINIWWPSPVELILIILSGLLGVVLSNYLWALTVVLLDPVTTTLGLNLQIPIVVLLDSWTFHQHSFKPGYIIGSSLVICGVIVVSAAEEEKEDHNSSLP